MAFNTVDNVINAVSANLRAQGLEFNKTTVGTPAVGIPHTLWTATGLPEAGGSGSTATPRVLTSSTAGAMQYANPSGGRTMHLMCMRSLMLVSNSNTQLVLVDRIADCLLNASTIGTTSLTGFDATSRLGSAEGAKLWIEVASNLGAATFSMQIDYTDQTGTPGFFATLANTASQTVGKSINTNMWQPIMNTTGGIRSIQSYSITNGTTGTMRVCLVRPLLYMPMPVAGLGYLRDMLHEMPNLPRIYDNSCLSFIQIPGGGNLTSFVGRIVIAEN